MIAYCGFPTENRLTQSKEFGWVSRTGRRLTSEFFIALYTSNALSNPRLGVTVSKKVSKRAVQRNRIKRLLREFFRHHHHSLGNRDIVIIAKTHAAKEINHQLVTDLELLWRKLLIQ